jgi:uncharacterized protein (TIGR02231 family)
MFREINVKKLYLAATAVVLFLPAARVSAAELTTQAPISTVIVYPDRAEVTRSVELRIPKGSSTLVVPGLPPDIVPQSLRVSGNAEGGVHVTTIATELVRLEPIPFKPDPKIEAEMQALLKQKPPIEDRIAMAQMQCDYYKLLLAEAPQVSDKELIRSLDPQQWDSVWLRLSAKLVQAQDEVRLARSELQAIDHDISEHRKRQQPSQTPSIVAPKLAAHIGVEADSAATANIQVTYQVSGVSWQPFYHASLDSESGEVELIQYGELRQRTGEDWRGVSLVLSTARPAIGAMLPELITWRLQDYRMQQSTQELSRSAFGADVMGGIAPSEAPAIENSVAQLAATEFAAEYRIPGEIDLVSGGGSKRIAIAEHRLKSHLAARVVPKLSLQAHLYATATYGGSDPLLPGSLTVFRDGALLGTSNLPMLRPQEEFSLGFGADEKIHVEHKETPIDPETAGIFGDKRRIERQFVTRITSYHQQPIEITLLDRVPVSSSEDISIELTRNTTPVSVLKWQDRDGVIAWTSGYKAAEEKTINFGYTVTYPQEMMIGNM